MRRGTTCSLALRVSAVLEVFNKPWRKLFFAKMRYRVVSDLPSMPLIIIIILNSGVFELKNKPIFEFEQLEYWAQP